MERDSVVHEKRERKGKHIYRRTIAQDRKYEQREERKGKSFTCSLKKAERKREEKERKETSLNHSSFILFYFFYFH